MKRHAELHYDARSDLLTAEVTEAGEVARRLEADGLRLGLTRAGVVADFTIENFSSFTRFDVLYVFGGASFVRALSEHQLRVEDGVVPETLVIEFDPPKRTKRDRDAKTLTDAGNTFAWVP